MAFRLPRISIVASDERGMANAGELNVLSLGFGLHLAWMQTELLGPAMLAGGPSGGAWAGAGPSLPFAAAMASFLLTLLFAAVTDQKLLPLYTAKRAIFPAAGLAALGAALLGWAAPDPAAPANVALALPAGAALGVGGALLTLFWGVAFSRHGALTIGMNASVACAAGLVVCACALQALAAPWDCVAGAAIPTLEMPLLWQLTPTSYAVRHEVPIFNPLPVNKASFAARLALPLVLFGFCLGVLGLALRAMLATPDETAHAPALLAGGTLAVLVVAGTAAADEGGSWDSPFRLAVPLAMAALLLLPAAVQNAAAPASLALVAGTLCLAALLWAFFGEMAQQFRLSPLFLYGAGLGMLALGAFLGVLAATRPELLETVGEAAGGAGAGGAGAAVAPALALTLAFALLPRVRDVKRAIRQQGAGAWEGQARCDGHSPSTRKDMARAASAGAAGGQQETPAPSPKRQGVGAPPAARAAVGGPGPRGAAAPGPAGAFAAPGGAGLWERAFPERAATGTHAAFGDAAAPLAAGASDHEADPWRERGRFREQCETIANRYLLSRRETEVMFLLAKGCNAARIQEKLCISKSTAKTHISHIYRKLDIHTQQELLRMVDEECAGQGEAGRPTPERGPLAAGSGRKRT